MYWKDFIQPELLALMPFLYGVGVLIRNTPKIKKWLIPYILWGISIIVTLTFFILQTGKNFNGITFVTALGQATLLALATVGGNECIKQATVGRKKDNKKDIMPPISDRDNEIKKQDNNKTDKKNTDDDKRQ